MIHHIHKETQMPIYPLQSLLSISDDPMRDCLLYLPPITTKHLGCHEFISADDDLFLSEMVVCVSKQTGLCVGSGKLVSITSDKLVISHNRRNIYMYPQDIYVFRKLRKQRRKKQDREFYEALLHLL
jgi:hypothetical protein